MEELQAAGVTNRPTNRSILCTVNTNDQYFFLSQLQLLKTKHIEYGIYWYNNPR